MRLKALPHALTLALTIACVLFASTGVTADSCSCSAPDGNCSASASCSGGCTAFCANDGECLAQCSGHFGFLEREITLQMQNGDTAQLLAKLANASGKDLTFSSAKPDTLFNLDFKRAALWDVLEILSGRGTVRIQGQNFEKFKSLRRILLSGERISLCVQNTPVNIFISDLANLTGQPIHLAGGSTKAIVTVKLRDVNLQDILAKVSEQTGTRILDQP